MIDLTITYAGLTLRNPLIIGSSSLTNTAEKNKKLEEAGAGAIVLKSLFEEQIAMQMHALMQESDAPEAAAYIESYVKANHVEEYLNVIRESKAACSIPIIASINCYDADTWTDFARQIQEAGADALELNVFYLCTDLWTEPNDIVERYVSIVQKVKEQVDIPVIMKIGKQFSNIPLLVNDLKVNGASGVVLFNRYYQPDIDLKRLCVTSGHVFSNAVEIADTLRWTAIVSGKVSKISIAASTGIHSGEDVLKCVLAGASATQICSVVYEEGISVIGQILADVSAWMEQSNNPSLSQLRGRLNAANIGDQTLYERSQFMKYFASQD